MTADPSTPEEPTRERVRATIGQVGGYWRPLAGVARLQEELGELAELFERERSRESAEPFEPEVAEPFEPEVAEPFEPETGEPETENAEPFEPEAANAELCASELADLWIITTALADQFLIRVPEPHVYARRSPDSFRAPVPPNGSQQELAKLLVAAGRIARIVNHYDGPKTPRTFDGWMSLSDAVAEFHRALVEVARAHEVDLGVAVSAKLDAIPVRDTGRFGDGHHDPSTVASLERFRPLYAANGSLSPGLRLWGAPEWSSRSFASNAEAMVGSLTSFTKAARWERLGGYLIAGPSFSSTARFEDWLERLLTELRSHDPMNEQAGIDDGEAGGEAEDHADSDAEDHADSDAETHADSEAETHADSDAVPGPGGATGRPLLFHGLPLLAMMFSPLYNPGDPRHCPAGSFVLLQAGDSAEARPAP